MACGWWWSCRLKIEFDRSGIGGEIRRWWSSEVISVSFWALFSLACAHSSGWCSTIPTYRIHFSTNKLILLVFAEKILMLMNLWGQRRAKIGCRYRLNTIRHHHIIPPRCVQSSRFWFCIHQTAHSSSFLHNILWLWNGTCDTWAIDEMMCMCWKQYSNYAEYTSRPAERRAVGNERRDVEMCSERRRRWLKWNTKSTACSNTGSFDLHQASTSHISALSVLSHPVFRQTSQNSMPVLLKKARQKRTGREKKKTKTKSQWLWRTSLAKIGQLRADDVF